MGEPVIVVVRAAASPSRAVQRRGAPQVLVDGAGIAFARDVQAAELALMAGPTADCAAAPIVVITTFHLEVPGLKCPVEGRNHRGGEASGRTLA